MKRTIIVAVFAVMLAAVFNACKKGAGANIHANGDHATLAGNANDVNKTDSFPWKFPQDFTLKGVETEQTVLSPAAFYTGALQRGEDLSTALLPIYNYTVQRVGENTLTLSGMGEEIEVPQALAIALPKDEKAQNGDIVLTWWQSGQGLQRAIVVDDTNPLAPKVCYLDLDYRDDGRGFANSHANESLKPGSFKVLKSGEWTSGATVAVEQNGEWKTAIILNAKGDYLLLTDAQTRISAEQKANCRLIPIETNYEVGDEVFAKIGNSLQPACKVAKIDKRVGRVKVEKNGHSFVLSMLEVVKNLERQQQYSKPKRTKQQAMPQKEIAPSHLTPLASDTINMVQ